MRLRRPTARARARFGGRRVNLRLTAPPHGTPGWSVPFDAVLTRCAGGADGPPLPPRPTRPAQPPTADDLPGWLAAWAPVQLVLDDPSTVLQVATPRRGRR
jgi:hypothetical protein